MQTNVLVLDREINYKLLFQNLMLVMTGVIAIVLSNDLQSTLVGVTSIGILLFNNFIYNPQRSRNFVLQAVAGVIIGFGLAVLMRNFSIAALPLVLVICFLIGFCLQVNSLLILVLAIASSLIINCYSPHGNLLIQLLWLLAGVATYWLSCILFDSYINEHKIIAANRVDNVLIDSWQNIHNFSAENSGQALTKINKQLDLMTEEIIRLQQLRAEYDYYCKLDDNLDCQIENNLHKLTSFHDLITKQVYNTMLNQNQQLKAEQIAQEFDELSD